MRKLLIICGPTATGKTKLALHLAKLLDGEIISADSRQVYKGMDIGTGKDWGDGSIKIWGYDLVGPKEEFSISQYVKFATNAISEIGNRKKLPIIVGGTGFYIKGVVGSIETLDVPRDLDLRKKLENKSTEELFKILLELDGPKAESLNESDKNNPRRLIRAIEVAKSGHVSTHTADEAKYDTLFVGLRADKDAMVMRIKNRVKERVAGVLDEIRNLLKKDVSWSDQSMTSLGYKEWKDFFKGKIAENEAVRNWTLGEIKYAKRQMTWFKGNKRINWFDVTNKDSQKNIEKLVNKWYSSANESR